MTQSLFSDLCPSSALFSYCQTYRYTLRREWSAGPCVAWIMLNPSTADYTNNDQTIRKCIGFSQRWGFGRLIVLNLFALRSTDPRNLAKVADPVGPQNDHHIAASIVEATKIVCAWGCQQHLTTPALRQRPGWVVGMIPRDRETVCLGYRNDGAPRHPLMVAYSVPRERFWLQTAKSPHSEE